MNTNVAWLAPCREVFRCRIQHQDRVSKCPEKITNIVTSIIIIILSIRNAIIINSIISNRSILSRCNSVRVRE